MLAPGDAGCQATSAWGCHQPYVSRTGWVPPLPGPQPGASLPAPRPVLGGSQRFSLSLTEGGPQGYEGLPHPKVQAVSGMLFFPFQFQNPKCSVLIHKRDITNSFPSSKHSRPLGLEEHV